MTRLRRPSASSKRAGSPEELRLRLEAARLDLRALYRVLDRMLLAQELPRELHRLQELDADFAEALWVLDQPPGRFDLKAMVEDTLASLEELPEARAELLDLFDERMRLRLEMEVKARRLHLLPEDAYLEIPGRDPAAR